MTGYLSPTSIIKAGNLRPPEKTLVLRWIKELWAMVSPDIIKKSFLKTGIANCLDGTGDDMFFNSDDSDDDPFKGYEVSAGEMDGRWQLAEILSSKLMLLKNGVSLNQSLKHLIIDSIVPPALPLPQTGYYSKAFNVRNICPFIDLIGAHF